jgi:hypothetical protein
METLLIPICSRAGDGAGEAASILVAAPMSKSSSGTDPACVEVLHHSGGADASGGPDVLVAAGARGGPCSRQRVVGARAVWIRQAVAAAAHECACWASSMGSVGPIDGLGGFF